MNEDLKRLRDAIATEKRLRKEENRVENEYQSELWKKEEVLLPQKLEMAEYIFSWGRDLLADENYRYLRGIGISDGLGDGILVYAGPWGHRSAKGGGDEWSRFILLDDGSFLYSFGTKWLPLDGCVMDSPEALAVSLLNDYITELHTVARKEIDDVLSEITVWYSNMIRLRLMESTDEA